MSPSKSVVAVDVHIRGCSNVIENRCSVWPGEHVQPMRVDAQQLRRHQVDGLVLATTLISSLTMFCVFGRLRRFKFRRTWLLCTMMSPVRGSRYPSHFVARTSVCSTPLILKVRFRAAVRLGFVRVGFAITIVFGLSTGLKPDSRTLSFLCALLEFILRSIFPGRRAR